MANNSGKAVLSKAVPNGTTIFSPEVIQYVERYRSFAKQTADSIVQLGLTLIEAEEKLNPVDFELFCEEVSVPKGGPVYKKLRVIGASAGRFTPYAGKLPNTWTTLYRLASINPDQFERVVESLNPFITAKEIEHLLGSSKETNAEKNKKDPDFIISLDRLDIEDKASVFDLIYKLKSEFNFSVIPAKKLKEEIVNLKKTAKAA